MTLHHPEETPPDQQRRIGEAQAAVLDVFNEHDLQVDEALSVLSWLTAQILYSESTESMETCLARVAESLSFAFRHIERQQQKGRVPLA